MAAKFANRHQLRPPAKMQDQRKIQPITHKESSRGTLGEVSMKQVRPNPPHIGMERRRYPNPAIELPSAARKPGASFPQKNGLLRQLEVPLCRDQSNILSSVAPELIHLQRYEGLGRREHPLGEHQDRIHESAPLQTPEDKPLARIPRYSAKR